MNSAKPISREAVLDFKKSGKTVRLLDVRSEQEYKENHIPEAEHLSGKKIERGDFSYRNEEILVTVCGSGGGRSESSAAALARLLNCTVYFLEEGTFGWLKSDISENKPSVTMLQKFLSAGYLPNDSEEDKIKKSSLLVMSVPFAFAGLFWGVLYFINGLHIQGMIPFSYGIISLMTVIHFIVCKQFSFFRFSQILLILLLPFFLQLSLGGFIHSSAVIIWAVISPLGALTLVNVSKSLWWFALYALLVICSFVLNDYVSTYFQPMVSDKFVHVFFLMNILGVSAIIYFLQYYFVSQQTKLQLKVQQQHNELRDKNGEIRDSINYAKRIQYALLAGDEILNDNLKEHFVLFKPKDIVSGDFYWAALKHSRFYLAVCDSTGHGVPGAFMSLLNISFLNEAINERRLEMPHDICNYVRSKLVDSISHDGARDGMDGILICWDRSTEILYYTAANNSPFLLADGHGKNLEADKMPIGKGESNTAFRTHELRFKSGDTLYLYTDGYADQFGGPKGKKFKYKQLHQLLSGLQHVPIMEQKRILEATIVEWKGDIEQTDDILVIGMKLV